MNMSITSDRAGLPGMSDCSGSKHGSKIGSAQKMGTGAFQVAAVSKAKSVSLEANLGQKVDIEV